MDFNLGGVLRGAVGAALAAAVMLLASPAWADPCKAIPDRGPLPAYLAKGQVFSGPVSYVADGDGLCIAVGRSGDRSRWVEVRLGDYYAGELYDEGGQTAKDTLARITRGQRIVCTSQGRKTYDRVVAICRIGGVSLGERMRRAGIPEAGRGWRAGR